MFIFHTSMARLDWTIRQGNDKQPEYNSQSNVEHILVLDTRLEICYNIIKRKDTLPLSRVETYQQKVVK